MKQLLTCVALSVALTACASSPDQVSPSYISPLAYSGADCDQLRAELIRVSDQVRVVSGQQRSAATRDAVAVTVGVVIFWPALFLLMGGSKKDELASLKGQYDALRSAAIAKKCPVADELAASEASARDSRTHDHRTCTPDTSGNVVCR